jgi:REP element-mobilizing transposase RayT
VVFDDDVDAVLREVCLEIALRHEISFLEIGTDGDHVHFLVQSVPSYSPTKIVRTIKSLSAREIFKKCPQVKKQLWGGQFWSDGYYIASVGMHANAGHHRPLRSRARAHQTTTRSCTSSNSTSSSSSLWFLATHIPGQTHEEYEGKLGGCFSSRSSKMFLTRAPLTRGSSTR